MIVEVPDEKLLGMNLSPARLRLEMAVGLYASEDATLGQAAALADLNQTQFLRELGRRGIRLHYDLTEFEEDLKTLKTLPDK